MKKNKLTISPFEMSRIVKIDYPGGTQRVCIFPFILGRGWGLWFLKYDKSVYRHVGLIIGLGHFFAGNLGRDGSISTH